MYCAKETDRVQCPMFQRAPSPYLVYPASKRDSELDISHVTIPWIVTVH